MQRHTVQEVVRARGVPAEDSGAALLAAALGQAAASMGALGPARRSLLAAREGVGVVAALAALLGRSQRPDQEAGAAQSPASALAVAGWVAGRDRRAARCACAGARLEPGNRGASPAGDGARHRRGPGPGEGEYDFV